MTDRDLLELAAKAAGMKLFVWGGKGQENFTAKNQDGSPGARWNPLQADGDALRLAVSLNISICRPVDGDSAEHWGTYAMLPDQTDMGKERDGGDPYASTRRAIVRAAAEIGKAMP